ncbi:dystroglycan-related [Anaeramoeba flamelloides]|uniref:Dystroglycan-related n=1 Tax=Anaeramoeba flamelloides TaxID=1746091 RepID=A0ABQ8Z7Q8_9EUKA|nr:dystroglycan-related [Anaeramoeba flamelloides]
MALENAIGTIELDTTTEWEFEVPDETFSGTDLEYSASPYSESNIKSSASPYIAEESEVWWSFESESKMFSGTTPAGCESEWQIELTASNSQGSKSDIFVVSVSNPAVTSNDLLTAQTAYSNQRFVYELETDAFIDSQDDSLTYSADVILDGDQIASLPTWLKIDASTGTFTGTPKYKQCSETLNIRVNANDDCPDNGASDNFELEIVNERPTTNYQSTTYEAIVAQEFEFSLGDNIFSDEYLNRIKIYSKVKNDEGKFEAKPYWLLFDKDTFTFYGEVPKTECSQELNVYVFATDKCHKRVSVNFILQITRPDIQPNPDYPLPTQTIHQHKDFVFYFEKKQLFTKPVSCKYNYDAYLYNGNANDETIDQNLLEDLPSWIQFSERDLSFSGNYQETVCEEVYQIVIMAMDKCENTAFNQFQIIVQDNLPVVYVPLKTQRIRGRRRWNYIFDENSFMDPENTELTYQAFEHTPFPFTNKLSSQTTDDLQPLPDWIDFDPQTRSFTGKIPPHQCDGQLNIAVVAQDECLSKTRAEFALKVNNLAPRVKNELEPKTLIKGNTIDFFIPEDTFVDPEGGKLTYGFHTNIRQHWLDLDKDTGRFTGYVAYNIGRTATISVYAIDVCGNKKQTPLEFNFKMPVESENDDQP